MELTNSRPINFIILDKEYDVSHDSGPCLSEDLCQVGSSRFCSQHQPKWRTLGGLRGECASDTSDFPGGL